ncbi:4205_t:CDS:1 [Paraglomus brasilianum]|uniref:4205_t:CDS:1 n=1 Tax=Paraglomus brasilianum TaxID=144538 RepID=A0A9N9BJN1_9GLOM|nr:4205_t:CDS:1 [Paraglomus brasilianum]
MSEIRVTPHKTYKTNPYSPADQQKQPDRTLLPVNPPQNLPPNNPPPPPNPPQVQQQEEMAQATYPAFDGTNPRKWLNEMDIAFTVNNIQADAHERRIGSTKLWTSKNMVPFQQLPLLHSTYNAKNHEKTPSNTTRSTARQQTHSRD